MENALSAGLRARVALEKAENSEDSIVTGGNLTLVAGGEIGSDDNALGVNVAGTLSVQVGDVSADGVNIEIVLRNA